MSTPATDPNDELLKASLLPAGAFLRKDFCGAAVLLTHPTLPNLVYKVYHLALGQLPPPSDHDPRRMTREIRAYAFIEANLRRNPQVSEAFLHTYSPVDMPPKVSTRLKQHAVRVCTPAAISQLNTFHRRCLPMEHVEYGVSFTQVISTPRMKERWSLSTRTIWLRRLRDIILECHRAGIAHNDIQTRHVIVDLNPQLTRGFAVRVIDWGTAIIREPENEATFQKACLNDARSIFMLNQVLADDFSPGGGSRGRVIPDEQLSQELKILETGHPSKAATPEEIAVCSRFRYITAIPLAAPGGATFGQNSCQAASL